MWFWICFWVIVYVICVYWQTILVSIFALVMVWIFAQIFKSVSSAIQEQPASKIEILETNEGPKVLAHHRFCCHEEQTRELPETCLEDDGEVIAWYDPDAIETQEERILIAEIDRDLVFLNAIADLRRTLEADSK